MLSVPTLWTVFVVNFLAVALIWAYVAYAYPKFEAAKFWAASSALGALGAFLAMLIVVFQGSLAPLICGATALVSGGCLVATGIERFYERPVSWLRNGLITGLTSAGIIFFATAYDSTSMRVLVYSVGQTLPMALTLKLLFSRDEGRANPGARLAGTVIVLIMALYAVRVIGNLTGVDFAFTRSS